MLSGRAVGSDQEAIQQLVQQQRLEAAAQLKVNEDERLLRVFQEHVLHWRLLQKDADAATDTNLADELTAQAHAELSHAQAMLRYFQAAFPDYLSDPNGVVSYDRELALETVSDPELGELDPEARFTAARRAHDVAVEMLAIVILLIVSLFFLTVAQFAKPSIRTIFAGAGVGVLVLGMVLFVLLEATRT